MQHHITAINISKNFAGEKALDNIDFSVPAGSLYGLIGADGAGKSTLLKLCTSLLSPDSGTISILGMDVKKQYQSIRSAIGYMPQKFSLYQDLSVRENLLFFADLFNVRGKERDERMQRLLAFSKLNRFQDRRAQNLSGGMKQKLALSCTLIHTPKLLLLDEPTTGVDPVSRKEFFTILNELKKDGITIVVSTPYMDEANLCDELLFLDHGKKVLCGKPKNLLESYPYDLFKVGSTDGSLSIPAKTVLPDNIVLLYPSSGALHAASAKNILNQQNVLSQIKTMLPHASFIQKVKPKIEDLFIHILSTSTSHE
jgi:ABC-type multidrug transport system ATPase subunit